MKTNKIGFILFAVVFFINILSQIQQNPNPSTTAIPIKHAKGRLKAIARGYMIEKQKNTNPFELHQNWHYIKKDIYKDLAKESYLNEQNQRVVNENTMPTMTDKVFKKLAMLNTDPAERRKIYVKSPDLISLKWAEKVVRACLRGHGITINDRDLLFDEIMVELKKYTEEENMVSKKLSQTIADGIIIRFKHDKQIIQSSTPKSYLQEFIANLSSWKNRFTNQIEKQDWNAAQ